MRTTILMTFLAVSLCSCTAQNIAPQGAHNVVQSDGLAVSLEIPKQTFLSGDALQATVIARNLTDKPILINAASTAPVYIGLWRSTGLYQEQVKRYPRFATMAMSPWTLKPKEVRIFVITLPVEQDWPRGEPLRLTAQLNGREGLAPGIILKVLEPQAATAPATTRSSK